MAYHYASILLFVILVLQVPNALVWAAPPPPPIPTGMSVYGTVYCSSTANAPGKGMARLDVKLNCYMYDYDFMTAGHALTNSKGFFNITIGDISNIDPYTQCYVYFDVPTSVGNCSYFSSSPSAHVMSLLTSQGNMQTAKYGLVQKQSVTKWWFNPA